jgi:hypothetical protein
MGRQQPVAEIHSARGDWNRAAGRAHALQTQRLGDLAAFHGHRVRGCRYWELGRADDDRCGFLGRRLAQNLRAKTKGIVSPVAGRADIFVVPDIEAGNMLAKQLEYLADAQIAGIVLGARVPIILTSRADKTLARLGSCAIALLLARHRGESP